MIGRFILVIALLCSTLGDKKEEEAKQKLQKMMELSADKKNKNPGLITTLSTSQFEKYITRGPRPYNTLLVLTANDPSSKCNICREVRPETIRLAKQIEQTREPESEQQLFVVEMDYTNNRELFARMQLTSAPQFVMIPSTKSRKEIPIRNFLKKVGKANHYSLMKGRTAENFAEFIQKTTKITVDFSRKFSQLEIFTGVVVLIVTLILLYLFRSYIDKIRRIMPLYATVAMAAYAFCIGGGMFNSIRKTPWHGADRQGHPEYISGASRYQYQVEGYMMGVANLVAGIGAFLFVNAQRDGFEKDSRGRSVSRIWAKMCPLWVPLVLVVLGWYSILYVYTKKNGHYQFGFVGMKG